MERIEESPQMKAVCRGNLGNRYEAMCSQRNGSAQGVLLSGGRVPAPVVGSSRQDQETKSALRRLLRRILRRSRS